MIASELRLRVESMLGERIRNLTCVAGGDINDAFRLVTEPGRLVFLKTHAQAPLAMFAAEAHGLEFLREAGAVRVPSVLGFSAVHERPSFLLLEFIEPGRKRRRFDEEFGRALAELHRAGAPSFGYSEPNFIGRLPQSNRNHESWAEFYREERLEPQLRAALAAGRAAPSLRTKFARLFARLPELVGDPEPPARLHGDLWSGNLHVDSSGAPCLIDPAVYGGHREMDLAMMRLFGGFSETAFAAYAEAYPFALGYRERVALHQLYPLLVHVNLFGDSYLSAVEHALSEYV